MTTRSRVRRRLLTTILSRVYRLAGRRIPLSRPDLTAADVEEVVEVLRSGRLTLGPKVMEFEERFAALLGMKYGIAVANGTSGLLLALRAVGVGAGTEVLTSPYTFVATANAILMAGARPVFVDVDPETLNIVPEAVGALLTREYERRSGQLVHRTRGKPLVALMPVAIFGHPVEMDGLRALADEFDLRIVHDTCESFGSLYYSRRHGAWLSEARLADAAVYAFFPNKQITTGEGGMIVTADEAIAERCRTERNEGRRAGSGRLEHEAFGFNFRMDELSAALGLAQLGRVDELLSRRAQVAVWYDAALANVPVERPRAASWAKVAWFMYIVRLNRGIDRAAVAAQLASRGIAATPHFPPVHLYPHLRGLGYSPGEFPVAEDAGARGLALPFYTTMTQEQVRRVSDRLWEAVKASVEA